MLGILPEEGAGFVGNPAGIRRQPAIKHIPKQQTLWYTSFQQPEVYEEKRKDLIQMKMKHLGAVLLLCIGMAIPCFAEYDSTVIKEVQQALNDAGFNCGTADGIAGKATANAIMEYQKANGLPEDGVISDELLESLGVSQYADILQQSLGGGTSQDTEASEEDSAASDTTIADGELSIDDLFTPAKFVDAYNRFYLDRSSGQNDEYVLSLSDENADQTILTYSSTNSSTLSNRTGKGFCLQYDPQDTDGEEADENAVYSKAVFKFDLSDYKNSLLTDLLNVGSILEKFLQEPRLQMWFTSSWDAVFFALGKNNDPVYDSFKGEKVEFELHLDEDREYLYIWMTPVKAE